MGIAICERCQNRIAYMDSNTDFVHECNSGIEALDNEDVKLIGDFTDTQGTTTEVHPRDVTMQGVANALQGTRAGIEGEDFESFTSRGESRATTRTRQHFQYLDLRNKKRGQ